jgi:uncharacterized protein with PIN domain
MKIYKCQNCNNDMRRVNEICINKQQLSNGTIIATVIAEVYQCPKCKNIKIIN